MDGPLDHILAARGLLVNIPYNVCVNILRVRSVKAYVFYPNKVFIVAKKRRQSD